MSLNSLGLPGTPSYVICTSSTRPASPVEGQLIYETDTNLLYVYTGSAWGLYNYADSSVRIGCALWDSTNTALLVNTYVPISWDTEDYDPYGMHNPSVNPERITIPAGLGGLYAINLYVSIGAVSGTISLGVINLNGVAIARNYLPPQGFAAVNLVIVRPLAAGDYITGGMFSDSSSSVIRAVPTGSTGPAEPRGPVMSVYRIAP